MPFLRKYATLTVTGTTAIRVPIVKRSVVDFAVGADWTPATGDVKILIDGTAAANVTNLPTAIAGANTGAMWEFILTAAELTGKQIEVIISDAATKAVEDQCFIVETYGNASAMYAADLSAANLPANVTQLLGTAWLTPATAGTPDVNAKQIGATAQTGGDIYAYLSTNLGLLGASLSAIPKTGFKLASDGLAAVVAWTVAITGNITGNLSGSIGSYTGNTPQTGDAFARLGSPSGVSTSADLATLLSRVSGNVLLASSYTAPDNTSAQAAAASASSADSKASTLITNVAAVPTALLDLASGVETNLTVRQMLRLMKAVMAGVATDSAGTYIVKRADGTTTAATIAHDSSGNRTSITIGTL